MDPYYISPLWPDRVSLAAIQARVLLEKNIITPEQMITAVIEARTNSKNNKNALVTELVDKEAYLAS